MEAERGVRARRLPCRIKCQMREPSPAGVGMAPRPQGRRGGRLRQRDAAETPQPERRSLGDDRLLGPWRLMLVREMERAGVLVQLPPLHEQGAGDSLRCEAEVK